LSYILITKKFEVHELSCKILKQIASKNLLCDEYEVLRGFYIDALLNLEKC